MTLSVIGAGLGRTGTLSLKLALERLGFAPCCHMMEVFPHPERAAAWVATLDPDKRDWDTLFDGFSATVDWPGVTYWRELAAYYPDAKVILSVRDPERWFESTQATIFNPEQQALAKAAMQPGTPDLSPLVYAMFDNRINDRAHCIEAFNRHNREVVDTIPPDRLLVFEANSGWEPLCAFLGCDVPPDPFPHVNDSAFFREMMQRQAV